MRHTIVRVLVASALACGVTWLALLAAGDVALQRSIAIGAWTLFEKPVPFALVVAAGGAIGYLSARLGVTPIALLLGVLLGDAIAAMVLAPVLIGELELVHAPLTFAAVSVLGVQPAAILIGCVAGTRRRPAVVRV